jgi:hypothetical protein
VAKDDDPPRVGKRARSRDRFEQGQAGLALFVAEELALSLLPKVGSQGLPPGTQGEVRTPGTTEKRSLAGALELATGPSQPCVGSRQPTGLFLDLLDPLDRVSPAAAFPPLAVVADNAKIHHALAVERRWAVQPRFALLSLPTSCPKATPLERAVGAVHDTCTRHQTRKWLRPLGREVEQHLKVKGPWPSALSELSYTPEVTAAVQVLRTAETAQEEISQLAA